MAGEAVQRGWAGISTLRGSGGRCGATETLMFPGLKPVSIRCREQLFCPILWALIVAADMALCPDG